MIITLDGTVASGKSTLAYLIAKHYGFIFLSTGMLYRLVVYILTVEYLYSVNDLKNPHIDHVISILSDDNFQYLYDDDKSGRIFYKNNDVTGYLKDKKIDEMVVKISSIMEVRTILCDTQRRLGLKNNCVIDGRDTGSYVFPSADYKFYVTASLDVRVDRWLSLQKMRGNSLSVEEAKQIILNRDASDMNRDHGPLVIPQDAIIIDTSTITIDQAVRFIISNIHINKEHVRNNKT